MKMLSRGWMIGALMLTALACSDSDGGGSNGNVKGQATNCEQRCEKVASSCQQDTSQCAALCEELSNNQLSCIEKVDCDETKLDACITDNPAVEPGSGGSGGSGNTAGSGGSAPAGNCTSRCKAFASQCNGDPEGCGEFCAEVSETQLSCLEKSGCDQQKILACVSTGQGGAGGKGGAGGSGQTGSCESRCGDIATECGGDPSGCGEFCAEVSETQLTCLENAHCDQGTIQACLGGGSGGSGGSAGAGGSGAGDCASRCDAFAKECGYDPSQCSELCGFLTDAQLTCLENSSCDEGTANACIN